MLNIKSARVSASSNTDYCAELTVLYILILTPTSRSKGSIAMLRLLADYRYIATAQSVRLGVCSVEKFWGPTRASVILPRGLQVSSGRNVSGEAGYPHPSPRASRLVSPPPHHRHQSLLASAPTVRDMSSASDLTTTHLQCLL